MGSIKGTRTEQNLLKSFAGESQARNRYWYFASAAKKEGFEQISALFVETAENEKEHAKVFFKYLEGGPVEITATYPAGKIGTTAENLLAAAEGEKEEWSILYPDFARVAEQEGFAEVADSFREIAEVEAGTSAVTASCSRTSTTARSSRARRSCGGSAATAATCTRAVRARALPGLQAPAGLLRDLRRAVLARLVPKDACQEPGPRSRLFASACSGPIGPDATRRRCRGPARDAGRDRRHRCAPCRDR